MAWKKERTSASLPEIHSSIPIPENAGFWKTLRAFAGPGLLVAVGYIDPGNWATDIAGGSQFGYTLLAVILISNLFAMVLQHLAVKLGVVAGRDLAQACRDHYPPLTNALLWFLCELAIIACDLAEVIGSALALQLLFNIPLIWGIGITGVDVLLILYLQKRGFRWIESIVGGLLFIILCCFGYELLRARPDVLPMLQGLIPRTEIVTNPSMLYIAIGILGATVMPHNLYLHSSLVQSRDFLRDEAGKAKAIKFGTWDSTLSLGLAFFINGAILVLAASTFHRSGHTYIADITDAHQMLSPLLGSTWASILFAVALLASGQSSTLTGTLAGQIVMEGFLDLRIRPWLRRLITRLLAIIPAMAVAAWYGEAGIAGLLVFSQVILSFQLSFAVIPLVRFTSSRSKMGRFVNSKALQVVAWGIAGVILSLNFYLLVQTLLEL